MDVTFSDIISIKTMYRTEWCRIECSLQLEDYGSVNVSISYMEICSLESQLNLQFLIQVAHVSCSCQMTAFRVIVHK